MSSLPIPSVRSPLAAARSGTPKPAVQTVTALGRTAPSAKTTASGRTSVDHVGLEHRDAQLAQHLGDRATSRLGQVRPELTAADQRDVAPLLGELGGRLDPGQPGADHGHRCVRMQVVDDGAQALRLLQFGDGIGEFGRAGHGRRYDAGAADRVDDVVVVERRAGCQLHGAVGGVDAGCGVDDQLDAAAEQAAVVHGRVVVARDELVQPDPLDELRAGVDQCDVWGVPVAAHPQMVGRQCSGVAAADDDDLWSRGEPRIV